MGKIKTGLVAAAGLAIGVVTLRKLRGRGSENPMPEEASDDIEEAKEDIDESREDIDDAVEEVTDAKEEAITAAKHAAGALKHAGLATGKAIQAQREKTGSKDTSPEPVEIPMEPDETK
jgi:predicted phage gp36 major capsid-like protein